MSQTPTGEAASVQADAGPWIQALRHSHHTLRALVEPLSRDQLQRPSYCSDWTIAQVVSHLGSQAEIFGLFIGAAERGEQPPGREAFPPIWDAWNGRHPEAQVADGLEADRATLARLESMLAGPGPAPSVHLFGVDADTVGLARMRLGEHAIHTWDVAVSLDPEAEVPPEAAALLVDTVGQLAGRVGQGNASGQRVEVRTTGPDRHFTLDAGEPLTLTPASTLGGGPSAEALLVLPAAALVRLVYGRLDPGHTPPVESRQVDLEQLRPLFPGF